MSVKQRLQLVSQYIRERRFTEAKAILVQLDHPIAHKWLAQLDDHSQDASPKKAHLQRRTLTRRRKLTNLLWLTIIGLIILLIWGAVNSFPLPDESHLQRIAEEFQTESALIINTNIPPILILTLTPTEEAP